jgi:hypothetical protein
MSERKKFRIKVTAIFDAEAEPDHIERLRKHIQDSPSMTGVVGGYYKAEMNHDLRTVEVEDLEESLKLELEQIESKSEGWTHDEECMCHACRIRRQG